MMLLFKNVYRICWGYLGDANEIHFREHVCLERKRWIVICPKNKVFVDINMYSGTKLLLKPSGKWNIQWHQTRGIPTAPSANSQQQLQRCEHTPRGGTCFEDMHCCKQLPNCKQTRAACMQQRSPKGAQKGSNDCNRCAWKCTQHQINESKISSFKKRAYI